MWRPFNYKWFIVAVLLIMVLKYSIGPEVFKPTRFRSDYLDNVINTSTTETLLNFSLTFEPEAKVSFCQDLHLNLTGRIPVVTTQLPSEEELEHRFSWLKGGHHQPKICQSTEKVAIIIPSHNRHDHLMLLFQHLHPLLQRQRIDYTIFVVDQYGDETLNKARIMNAAFKEALKFEEFDCFIFHDVDLLLEDDRLLYRYADQPRHLSVAINTFNYKLPYVILIGGVFAITRKHFELVNGYSNEFCEWGGEDDDLYNRITYHKLHIIRDSEEISRFTMIDHLKRKPGFNRFTLVWNGAKRFDLDGLCNLNYTIREINPKILAIWLLFDIGRNPHQKSYQVQLKQIINKYLPLQFQLNS